MRLTNFTGYFSAAGVVRYACLMHNTDTFRCLSLPVSPLVDCCTSAYPLEAATTAPFPDMAKSWFGYQDNVTYLKAKGAIGVTPMDYFTLNRR